MVVRQVDNAIVMVIVVVLWISIAAVSAARLPLVHSRNLYVSHNVFLDVVNAVQVRIE